MNRLWRAVRRALALPVPMATGGSIEVAQRQQLVAAPRPVRSPIIDSEKPSSTGRRMYAMHPLLVGPLTNWRAQFARIAALGFDAVSLPPPFQPVAGADLFRVGDYDRMHPVVASSGDADVALRQLATAARSEGLALYLDIDLGRAARHGLLAGSMPDAFERARDDDARDPRRPPAERGLVRALWQYGSAAEPLQAWWSDRLGRWAAAGVAGFRCLHPALVPASVWALLTAALPRQRFLAWLPGTDRAAATALRGAGFAGVFDSLAWWDCRAAWYPDELAAYAALAPTIATVEAPFGPRFAARFDQPDAAAAAGRQLAVGALGSGVLVPMGFEFGARHRLDPATDRPGDWDALLADPPADLCAELRAVNAVLAERSAAAAAPVPVTGPDSPMTGLCDVASGNLLLLNPDLRDAVSVPAAAVLPESRLQNFRPLLPDDAAAIAPDATVRLRPGEARLYRGEIATPIRRPAAPVAAAIATPRVAIEAVAPTVDSGRFPVKRTVGEPVAVTADLICDGHDRLAGVLRWRNAGEAEWREVPLQPLGNDSWGASFPLERVGRHVFAVEAWVDNFASFRHGLDAKVAAGQEVALELEEGRRLVAALASVDPWLATLDARLAKAADPERLSLLRAPETASRMTAADPRPHRIRSAEMPVEADRLAARFASWYELFPRSQSGDEERHGTFEDVVAQLPRIRAMGFDVLYFPPIHPIGRAFRKGRNNSLTPAPEDPGSPYAIGSEAGGHDAIHPELGTIEDFRRLRDAAAAHGLELAIDFAVQCSPDHPWLREHREWFAWRPDGSLRYAENPPKKYQDIVNVDFHAPAAIPDLWLALRDIVRFWANEGVRLFRVDNPHTKPLPFWEWLIADIRGTDPDIEFLAEAFTRPKVMYRLAKLGFGQSYTYFTWRNEKREIMDYLTELTTTAPRDFFRPHFFVNTPDINPVFLQGSGRPGFLIRAALAGTLSGLWGMYQGFEFCEARALPGREEYLDSEKYQIRVWPERAPGDIVDEVARLNAIRRGNPALHDHLGVAFHVADNDRVLWYRKRSADGTNVLLVAVSLDPFAAQEATVEVPLWEWALPDDGALEVEELMQGERTVWQGKLRRLRLDPAVLPFAIWRVRPVGPFRPHLPPVAAAPAPTGHG